MAKSISTTATIVGQAWSIIIVIVIGFAQPQPHQQLQL
jgi:hypothetical protein